MGAEISQVRRETDFYIKASEISRMKKKKQAKAEKKRKDTSGDQKSVVNSGYKKVERQNKMFIFKQKETEDMILSRKMSKKEKNEAFRNKLSEKRRRKKEKNEKWRAMKARQDDFLGSVFVGSKEN